MGIISGHNEEIRRSISDFERKIDEIHLEFRRYHDHLTRKMPDWERLEALLMDFSRRKILDLELSMNLERVLFKFQISKRIWLRWVEAKHHGLRRARKKKGTTS